MEVSVESGIICSFAAALGAGTLRAALAFGLGALFFLGADLALATTFFLATFFLATFFAATFFFATFFFATFFDFATVFFFFATLFFAYARFAFAAGPFFDLRFFAMVYLSPPR